MPSAYRPRMLLRRLGRSRLGRKLSVSTSLQADKSTADLPTVDSAKRRRAPNDPAGSAAEGAEPDAGEVGAARKLEYLLRGGFQRRFRIER